MTMVYIFVIGVIVISVIYTLHHTFIVEPRLNKVPKTLFKSSLKNNMVDDREVFQTLKEASIEPCFLENDLNKKQKIAIEYAIEGAEKFDGKLNLRQASDERMNFLADVAHTTSTEENSKAKTIGIIINKK